jgi:heme/copper-type cytochrome/quinol oxidase subunit 4
VQETTWNTAIILFALVVPWPVLGGICWWFWKHRDDD